MKPRKTIDVYFYGNKFDGYVRAYPSDDANTIAQRIARKIYGKNGQGWATLNSWNNEASFYHAFIGVSNKHSGGIDGKNVYFNTSRQ